MIPRRHLQVPLTHLPRLLQNRGHSLFTILLGGDRLLPDVSHAVMFLKTKSSHKSCKIDATPHIMDDTPVY